MSKTYKFAIGTDPYNTHGRDTRCNGEWTTTAEDVDEALQIIFASMQFPCEATGRKHFIRDVSLVGVPEQEVIQVWSSEPEVIKHTASALGEEYDTAGLHDGRGRDYGLVREVKVTEIDKYCHPAHALLAAPNEPGNAERGISPMGASVIKYHEIKHDIQMATQQQRMEVARKQWEVKALAEGMRDKMKDMQEQIGVFDAYLNGTRHRTVIARGHRGKGKYHVFQNRVFLSEEIAVLGNFVDMDFKGMEALEQWLVKSGHIWKMLPHERCILATRIRQEKKDYGNPLANVWNNEANMQNIIWIRDGENVFHVDVEYQFNHAVFPYRDQFDRAKRVVQDHVWKKAFKVQPRTNFFGEKLKPSEYDEPGQMCRKPLEVEEPYCTVRTIKARFKTIESWLDSDAYPDLLDKQITEAVSDYLREQNKKQMLFAVIIQGIVDNTDLLDIPKGTDMFNWENVDKHLILLYDYSHGLPYPDWANRVNPFLNGKVKKGDWIVAMVDEYIPRPGRMTGTEIKERRPILFKVSGIENIETRQGGTTEICINTGERTVKEGTVTACHEVPVVRYHPKAKHWRREYGNYADYQKARSKTSQPLTLKASDYILVPMSPQYAKDILNDRDWKKANRWAVPLMVNYDKIIQVMKKPENMTVLKWDDYDD